MTDAEVESFLVERGVGVLALAADGDAYAVPISFGYDGDEYLYFDLIKFGTESRKLDYLAETSTACVVTSAVSSQFDWRSVVAFGALEPVPEAEETTMKAVMEDNAWYPSLFPGSEQMTGVERYRLELDGVSGRKGEDRQ